MIGRGVTHRVKIDNHWWTEIAAGRKTAELRYDDRDYQVGDRLVFVCNGITYGERTITHVLKNCEQWGLRPGFVMLSLNNPDYDWHVEASERRSEWLATAERRVAALKGAMTKQRKKYDALMDDYRRQHDSLCDYRQEALAARRAAN
jgi:hypothetical protein